MLLKRRAHLLRRFTKPVSLHPLSRLFAGLRLTHLVGWPLNKKFGHSLDAFKLSIT